MKKLTVLGVLFAGLTLSPPTHASDAINACLSAHNQCTQICLEKDGDGAKAACIAQCAGVEAQCVGKIGLETTEPFLRKKADQLEGLIEEFFKDILPRTEEKGGEEPMSLPPRQTDT